MHCPMTRSDLSLALRRIGGDLVASQEVYDCCGVAWIVEHGIGSNVLQRIGCVATCPNEQTPDTGRSGAIKVSRRVTDHPNLIGISAPARLLEIGRAHV